MFFFNKKSDLCDGVQNRVTDHRIGLTVHNIHGMMEGNLLGEFLDGLKAKYEREVLESVLDG